MKHFQQLIIALAFAVSLGSGAALAQEDATVSGEITDIEVREDGGTITIRRDDNDRVESFRLTPETEVDGERDPNSVFSDVLPPINDVGDLRVGDAVELKTRTDNTGASAILTFKRADNNRDRRRSEYAAGTRNDRTAQRADSRAETSVAVASNSDRRTGQSYDSLPATATNWPLLAVAGAMLLLVGAGLGVAGRVRARL